MERIEKIDVEAIKKKMPKNPVAFDYVSDGLICDQGGDMLGSPKYYRNASKRLKRAQKKLSHLIESHIIGYDTKDGKRIPKYDKPLKECKNIEKQRKKIAKLSRHAANQRKDFLHKTSAAIAKAHDGVYVESLNMKDMSNKGFKKGKATLDNGYGMFLTMLGYKVEKNGGIFIKVDKWYPSSQLCSECGFKNPDVKNLNVTKWICPACGKAHDRNQNAAENILKEGTRMAKSLIAANAA